ncbi:PIN domain-containing protein [Nocardia sp. R16R-3T]
MIVADTNVLSEIMRANPDRRVVAWMSAREDITITAVTVGETWAGIQVMPEGRRRNGFAEVAQRLFDAHAGEILPYDDRAAVEYSRIVADRRAIGRPTGQADAMIAGICLANGCDLATRNVKDFADIGLTIVNPWE